MENWKPVVGFENLYHVSDLGRIKSLGREFSRKNPFGTSETSMMRYPEKLIHLHERGKGRRYLFVYLSPGEARRVRKLVHVAVLEAFVGKRPDGMQCCHKNGDPTDNRLKNLRWGTPKSNQQDRVVHGTDCRGEKSATHKLTEEQVKAIRRMHRYGEYGKGSYALARKYGVSQGCVDCIVSRRTWAHIP